jgi:hypothetical protein
MADFFWFDEHDGADYGAPLPNVEQEVRTLSGQLPSQVPVLPSSQRGAPAEDQQEEHASEVLSCKRQKPEPVAIYRRCLGIRDSAKGCTGCARVDKLEVSHEEHQLEIVGKAASLFEASWASCFGNAQVVKKDLVQFDSGAYSASFDDTLARVVHEVDQSLTNWSKEHGGRESHFYVDTGSLHNPEAFKKAARAKLQRQTRTTNSGFGSPAKSLRTSSSSRSSAPRTSVSQDSVSPKLSRLKLFSPSPSPSPSPAHMSTCTPEICVTKVWMQLCSNGENIGDPTSILFEGKEIAHLRKCAKAEFSNALSHLDASELRVSHTTDPGAAVRMLESDAAVPLGTTCSLPLCIHAPAVVPGALRNKPA